MISSFMIKSSESDAIMIGGHPFMTSAKFSDFLTPSPPCPHWATGLYYKIHATSLTLSAFPLPPSPLAAEVINGWTLMHQFSWPCMGS